MFTLLTNFLAKKPWQFSGSFPRFVKILEKLKIDLHLTLRHSLISELLKTKNPLLHPHVQKLKLLDFENDLHFQQVLCDLLSIAITIMVMIQL